VVHGREIGGKVEQFGVSGYVYKDVFLIFDRLTESLWYPFDDKQWTAISGPRRGETIPFLNESPVIRLGDWRSRHPNTVVLLGSRKEIEESESKK
jgi:hypothetical protein